VAVFAELAYNSFQYTFTIGGLMPGGDSDVFGSKDAHKVWGVRFGIIEGSADARGRVQVSLPEFGSTVWALVASPPGPASSGKFEAGDMVVVAFVAGDASHPVVLGRVGT
jgi:hypothetical protein